jgi:predicted DNA-binding transcriptional regulator AlpA
MTQHLLGVAEIAAMLGLSRQRVNQLIQRQDFPGPEAELSAGRIWTREAVEAWAVAHPTRATTGADAGTFARFTAEARAVIVRAQEEARSLHHGHLGTEHLLLAVLSDATPPVRTRLATIGAERDDLRSDIEDRLPAGDVAPVGHIPFTPRCKDVVVTCAGLTEGPVEPAHVARAVVRSDDGLAAVLLRERLGVDQETLVAEFDRVLGGSGISGAAAVTVAATVDADVHCSFCGRDHTEVHRLVAGPDVAICDQCVGLCNRIVDGDLDERSRLAARIEELAAELDGLRHEVQERRR